MAENEEEVIVFNETNGIDVPIGKTKIGGLPELPKGVEYPIRESYTDSISPRQQKETFYPALKMPLIAQINLADLYTVDHDENMPKSGLLYFFGQAKPPTHGAIWYIYLSTFGHLTEMKDKNGWHELT